MNLCSEVDDENASNEIDFENVSLQLEENDSGEFAVRMKDDTREPKKAIETLRCELCPKQYKYKGFLDNHTKKCHPLNRNSNRVQKNQPRVIPDTRVILQKRI